jgi:hypothetical protein
MRAMSGFKGGVVGGVMVILLIAGCRPAGLQVEFVEGIVLLDGAPVPDAVIGFSPLGDGRPATGRTDASGVFHLTAVQGGGAGRGVPVGDYVMTVSKMEYDLKGKPRPDDLTNVPVVYVVPQPYGDPKTSDLRVTVRKGGGLADTYRFELRSDFKGTCAGQPAGQ